MIPGRIQIGVLLGVVLCALVPAVLVAQEDGSTQGDDIERMVRDGMVEALQSRFRGGRTPEELRLLALAHANKAAQLSDDRQRQQAFATAETRYLAWISALEHDREAERVQRRVNAAAARVAYADMILSKWVVADLDKFEITAGKRGETPRLLGLLLKARGVYEQAAETIQPLAEDLRDADRQRTREVEEQYLALGVYDTILRVQLDTRFNLAWTNLYIGIVDPKNTERRTAGLRAAERAFQELVDSDQGGEMAARCRLGLAMTLREQGRHDAAGRYFDSALEGASDRTLAAQIRYERARGEIRGGRFEEARVTLRPLAEKDPDALEPEDRPARFYINLAHLWDANSYLQEAVRLRETAAKSPAREAIILRADRLRDVGLRKMNRLAARGGSWPTLVQLLVSDTIDPNADVKTLSPAELLFSARHFSEKKKYRHALAELQEAASREKVAPDLAAEILFELGVCHYRCRETRLAAEAFERLAAEYKSHPKAAQAVSYAYQLWATIAEQTKRREDYLHLADVLLNLLQRFPEHEKRAEAMWWLPVALQAGGRYQEAIEQFGNVPADSPQWEEAQYRRVLCGRLLFDAERATLSATELAARARQVTSALKSYAWQAYQRAERARDPDAAREWSGAALVSAAEVHASAGIEQYQQALDLLEDFEQRYKGSGQIGRVLAVRINAYRGLRQYEKAASVLEHFLRAVPPEEAGGTLAVVARGMQEEVERLERAGDDDAARKLALQALPTFEQLETWIKAEPSRAKYLDAVWYGLARMRYLAGQYQPAGELVARLLQQDPRDGNYQRLNALILTAALAEDAGEEEVSTAREAWGAMLRDPALRSAVPERYWEARYHYLRLLLREGRAGEVEHAIRQERVWHPDLDVGVWDEKLEELYRRAAAQAGVGGSASQPADTQPTDSQPAEREP
jgi:tetratricopeptide (TPR) repeat protein